MDDFWSALPIIAAPLGAAVFVYKCIDLFSNSRVLKAAVSDWLTKKHSDNDINAHFLIIRKAIFGERFFSVRRNVTLFVSFGLMAAFLKILQIIPQNVIDHHLPMLLFPKYYGDWYFRIWQVHPIICLPLLLSSVVVWHFSFVIFDYVTLEVINFANRVYVYVVLLFFGYLSAAIICIPVAVGSLATINYTFAGLSDETPSEAYWETFRSFPDQFKYLFFPTPPDYDDDNAFIAETLGFRAIYRINAKVGIIGTVMICLSAVIFVTILNVVHLIWLTALRIEYFIRNKYYDHDDILDEPLRYAGLIAAFTVFISVMGLQTASELMGQTISFAIGIDRELNVWGQDLQPGKTPGSPNRIRTQE